jgi:UDP-glucose 4-epimerase
LTHGITIITGGAGFIGSHLSEQLKRDGHRLRLIDDLSTGSRSNVEHLLDDQCELIEAKAAQVAEDPSLFEGVTRVFHLAAAVGVKLVVDDPAGMIRNNIDETDAVLRAAGRVNAAVLITSSSEVYGKCPVLPLAEDMDLVYGPTTASRWSYGLSKAIDEHLAIDLARRIGLRSVVVRLFNTIGPRQIGRYGMVVPRMVAQAVNGEPLTIYGDGEQTRAFCDVRDVVRALSQLIDTVAAYGGVYNVGSTSPISINTLADQISEAVVEAGLPQPVRKRIAYEVAYGEGFEDPPHRLPDMTRLQQAIGFSPEIKLKQTLRELVRDQIESSGQNTAASSAQEAPA